MCKRIYKSYKIRVINEDGERYIKLNGNVDTTSYNTMTKYYHMTKHKHQDEDCKVEMVGAYDDGTIGSIIFSKTFCKEVIEDKDLLKSTDEIVDEIKDLLDLLERKSEYHNNMLSVYNKKQDVLLHKIETIKLLDVPQIELKEKKLKIIDDLEDVRCNRRLNKNEGNKLKFLYDKVEIKEIIEQFSHVKIPIDAQDIKYIDEEYQEKIIKEIKYNSEKQRINLMSQVRHKYKKIVNDEARHTLVCYNYGYSGKKN